MISVAVDAQGAGKARPYVQAAGADFPTLVDEENLLSRVYGFKAVPNTLFIDEGGTLRLMRFGGFDIRRAEDRRAAEEWVGDGALEPPAASDAPAPGEGTSDALDLFRDGMKLYRQDRVKEALALWREAVALEPDNYVIRKQIWAVENPDRFYRDDVDYRWQKDQMARGL